MTPHHSAILSIDFSVYAATTASQLSAILICDRCARSGDDVSTFNAPLPIWLRGMGEVIRMASSLYGGKRAEMEVMENYARVLFTPPTLDEDSARLSLLDEDSRAMSSAARDALCEVFEVVPQAARHLAAWLEVSLNPVAMAGGAEGPYCLPVFQPASSEMSHLIR